MREKQVEGNEVECDDIEVPKGKKMNVNVHLFSFGHIEQNENTQDCVETKNIQEVLLYRIRE